MPCFYKDAGQDEEADQGKDDVSMVIKYNTNDHQDEDEPIQRWYPSRWRWRIPTQRWIANKTYQSRDRWRSLREFARPASDSLPRGWSRWPIMFLDPDQDVMFQNAFKIIMFSVMIFFGWWCQAPRRCGRWPEYGRRSQPQSLQQPAGHWGWTSHFPHFLFFDSITLKHTR